MSTRLRTNGLHITRYPPHIARYIMLKHRKQKANPKRYEMLYMAKNRYKSDGLNSLQYRRVALRENRSLTWMLVELGAPVDGLPGCPALGGPQGTPSAPPGPP
ncbi:beta-1,4-N-acetylgalactosaminyltransferase bre-4-like, partial [Nilaparvata lugens]|uniref:beta-1,4-N-acetylgalactosaminyltransferase bre-4-like n=1 Tax=Nilaparvata lugens TaxID=108931 RepID=UPI00193E61BF